jgi:hypothetical protein
MSDPIIICPRCNAEIKLTESLAAPLLESTRKQFEERLAEQKALVAQRELELKRREEDLAKERESIQELVAEKLKEEKSRIAAEEAKKARTLLGADLEQKTKELADLQEVLKQRDEKLAAAQKAEAEMLRKQRELDDAKRELELTIEKRIQESLAATRDQARKEAEEGLKLKVQEKEQTILSMQKQIEELKRKAEQGSQQLQGEVQELELESLLRDRFPHDTIEPVPKGEHGGDILQRVSTSNGQNCGTILWESKRTKNWSDGWLAKLRDDQRSAKAEAAVIVSQAMPKNVETFDLLEGVWVTSVKTLLPVATILRQTLIDLAKARQATEGQQTKMELIYQYLTGPKFRHRVQAIVEKFNDMQEDLDKERKTMTKMWAKREAQIRCVIESTAGMYGDMQGIAGKTLQEIEGLDILAIEHQESE